MPNPALYRYIDFIGGNILDASNVTLLQTELQRLGSQGLGQLYAQGALLNGVFNITGTSIVFTHANANYDIFAFINGQFEDLGATVSINGTQPTTGSANPLYLNWSWDIVTSVSDGTFIDGITGQPTIEAGQLSFQVSWVDTSGTPLNPSTQFGKNVSPIILAYFDMSVLGTVTPTYINGVDPYAFGTTTQAGLIRLSPQAEWIRLTTFTLGQDIVDSNGNIQQLTTAGTTSTDPPTWNVTLSGTTADGTAVWTNQGPAILGEAVNINDVSVTNARNPNIGSVYNASVAPLISSGINSSTLPAWQANTVYSVASQIVDSNGNIETVVSVAGTGTSGSGAPTWNLTLGGPTIDNPGANQVTWVNGGTASTTQYDPSTAGQGGIFTDSIIYTTLKEKLTTFLDSVNTNIENALIALSNHIGKPLGSSETHPFPTALQVGAAPLSHVGQVLGLGTSHPAQVNSDHSGFVVQRNPLVTPISTDYAYELTDGTNVLAGMLHQADFFANAPNAANAQGGNGSGGTATFTGTLGLMSLIANVLAEHVNYKSHGNNNPHNLDAADIGAVDAAFVDAQIQTIVDDVTAYTDAKTTISVRVVTTSGGTLPFFTGNPTNLVGQNPMVSNTPATNATKLPFTTASITNIIANIGGSFEIAFGFGSYGTNQQVNLPEPTGWSPSNFYATGSVEWLESIAYDQKGITFSVYVNPTSRFISLWGGSDEFTFVFNGVASVQTLAWRFITAPAIVISAYDNTAGTFDSGHVGDTVSITGRNFGPTQSGSTVSFNGIPVVTYSSWSSTNLVVVVPAGATTGLISVTIGANPPVTSPSVFTIS